VIRVQLAPEPPDFDARVRQPGLRAIAELVGEPPAKKRRGRPRVPVAARREDLKGEDFPPYWTEALDDLSEAYHRICAYICHYIEPVTGARSVDHMVPKSVAWDRVYEWDNYRLACALMNARKSEAMTVLDPFEVEDGWFELELVAFQVGPRRGLPPEIEARIDDTIRRLGLNDRECRAARGEYVEAYLCGDIRLEHLERRAPFIARELRRQGRLRAEEA
jgi:5-methylcytosine-specific restriction endonuclease McrA